MENDIHDLLVKAYLNYFEANEKFVRQNSVRTHRHVRKCLREIRSLAKERAEEIHTHHTTTRVTRK
jgi:hypothetical protein|tara:strand:+ start:565 stop:762 length:198 start_codon:yes stop_codon:yes gene_type:complete